VPDIELPVQSVVATALARLVHELPGRDRPRRLRRLGEKLGRDLATALGLSPARSRSAGLAALCRAAASAGFETTVLERHTKRVVLATQACPLRATVRLQPDAVALDHGLWSGLVAASCGIAATDVECATGHCLEPGACLIRIGFSRRRSVT